MKAALTEWSLLMESSLNGVGMAYKRRASGDEGEGEGHEHTNTCRGCVCSVDAVMTYSASHHITVTSACHDNSHDMLM